MPPVIAFWLIYILLILAWFFETLLFYNLYALGVFHKYEEQHMIDNFITKEEKKLKREAVLYGILAVITLFIVSPFFFVCNVF